MPSSLLSHQGIILPLKAKYPDRFDGTALCVGSFVPDLALIFSHFYPNHISPYVFHSVGGLIYTIPISLLLIVFSKKALFPAIAFLANGRPSGLLNRWLISLGVSQTKALKSNDSSSQWLIKTTYSVLIGILSHFLLDLPTHSWIPYLSPFYDGEMPEWFMHGYGELNLPFYGTLGLTNYNLLWILFSIGFGILALHSIQRVSKHRLLPKLYQTKLQTNLGPQKS